MKNHLTFTHMEYLLALNLAALAWFITHAEPLQNALDNTAIVLKTWYASIDPEWYHQVLAFIGDALYIILGCWMCLTLWLTFAVTGDFMMSCLASLTVSLIPDDQR